MEAPELKPCPFCGKSPNLLEETNQFYCNTMECPISGSDIVFTLEEWQKRTKVEEKDLMPREKCYEYIALDEVIKMVEELKSDPDDSLSEDAYKCACDDILTKLKGE